MKLLVLHTRLSGYFISCLRAFRDVSGAQILIFAWQKDENAPFEEFVNDEVGKIHFRTNYNIESMTEIIETFAPEAVLLSGWADNGYVSICRKLKKSNVPIISGCDTQWIGSLRQYIACLTACMYVRKFIDILWVCGGRQLKFARRLGFDKHRIWTGYYSCDWERFANVRSAFPNYPKFLFVGRFVPEKGVDVLVKAYKLYSKKVQNPWPLVCAGDGPLKHLLDKSDIENRGFVQPQELPELMAEASTFILPSSIEPWGVVIHEAAANSLPLILTNACGAGDHLLEDNLNGVLIKAGSITDLAESMLRIHHLDEDKLLKFGRISHENSKKYTPKMWAKTLFQGLKDF